VLMESSWAWAWAWAGRAQTQSAGMGAGPARSAEGAIQEPRTAAPATGAAWAAQDRSNSKAAFSLAGVVWLGK